MPKQYGGNQGQRENVRVSNSKHAGQAITATNAKPTRKNKAVTPVSNKRDRKDTTKSVDSGRYIQQDKRENAIKASRRKDMPAGSKIAKRGFTTISDPGDSTDEGRRALASVISINRKVFKELELWRFFDTDILGPSPAAPKFIIMKICNPINADNILVANNSSILPTVKVHYIYSSGLLFAYLIECPRWTINVQPNFASIVRTSSSMLSRFTEAKMLMQDANISVLHSEDGATLVCLTEKYSNLSAEIIKGGSGA